MRDLFRLPVLVLTLLVAGTSRGADPWHVQDAAVRFRIGLTDAPTHASAGYFVEIPDGGILPRAPIQSTVVAADGKTLKSFVLWPCTQVGAGVVFEAPASRQDLWLYISGNKQAAQWSPASGLTPSALLCIQSGRGGKADAQQLMHTAGAVNAQVQYMNRAGVPMAPLSVPGDLSGRQGPCSAYMLAHVNVEDPGRTLISPIEFTGKAEVLVDGKPIVPEKQSPKPGGTGGWVTLDKGIHRVEILSWSGGPSGPNGLMTLMWKTPNSSVGELGGARPTDLPFPGTPMWEARKLRDREIVRSGQAVVNSAEARDGRPLARIRMDILDNYWLGDEQPLMAFRLAAQEAGNPEGTSYEWNFGGGARLPKPQATWLFSGNQDHQVALTASAGGKSSTCLIPFFPYTTKHSNMNDAGCRENFRAAALDMFEAYPADKDPTANWTASHWNNFFRTMEINRGQDLLMHIFRARWDVLSRKLSPGHKQLLLTIFFDFLPRINPATAIKWTEIIEKQTRDERDAGMMRVIRAEVCMYYLNDLETARKLLSSLVSAGNTDEVAEWARIRYADAEFLARNMDAATKLYGEVQGRAKDRPRTEAGEAPEPPSAPKLVGGGLARSKAEFKAQREAAGRSTGAAAPKPAKPTPLVRDAPVAQWKVNAMLEASYAESAKSLLEQGFLLESRNALREWERRFPMSKISGDYIIQEAAYYMAVKDWIRAHASLSAYCDQVDASSFLPAAVEALLTCKIELKASNEDLTAFCTKMKKKLEFHPVGQNIDTMLQHLKSERTR